MRDTDGFVDEIHEVDVEPESMRSSRVYAGTMVSSGVRVFLTRVRAEAEQQVTWNYRLVRRKLKTTPGAESEYSIAIHEVYYDDHGKPDMVTEDAVGVYGETVDEVREAYVMMAEAFQQPVLNYEDITEGESDEG